MREKRRKSLSSHLSLPPFLGRGRNDLGRSQGGCGQKEKQEGADSTELTRGLYTVLLIINCLLTLGVGCMGQKE